MSIFKSLLLEGTGNAGVLMWRSRLELHETGRSGPRLSQRSVRLYTIFTRAGTNTYSILTQVRRNRSRVGRLRVREPRGPFVSRACFAPLRTIGLAFSSPAFAQEEEAGPTATIAGGVALASQDRVRGISLSNDKAVPRRTINLEHAPAAGVSRSRSERRSTDATSPSMSPLSISASARSRPHKAAPSRTSPKRPSRRRGPQASDQKGRS